MLVVNVISLGGRHLPMEHKIVFLWQGNHLHMQYMPLNVDNSNHLTLKLQENIGVLSMV